MKETNGVGKGVKKEHHFYNQKTSGIIVIKKLKVVLYTSCKLLR